MSCRNGGLRREVRRKEEKADQSGKSIGRQSFLQVFFCGSPFFIEAVTYVFFFFFLSVGCVEVRY